MRLRAANDPLAVGLQAVIVDLSPRLEASAKRLAELTPKSKEPAVSDSASSELAAEKQKHDALDADLRSAKAMLLQIDDIGSRIGAMRRDLFARQTFARSSSLLSPLLWIDLAREAPNDAGAIAAHFSDWLRALSARLSLSAGLGFLAVMLAIVALAAPLNWITRRVIARDSAGQPDRFRRALGAAVKSSANPHRPGLTPAVCRPKPLFFGLTAAWPIIPAPWTSAHGRPRRKDAPRGRLHRRKRRKCRKSSVPSAARTTPSSQAPPRPAAAPLFKKAASSASFPGCASSAT